MKPLFKQLPPLLTLTFFEAAARHGSFTRAADELCVTQSAVSKQIKLLEEYLGIEVFYRERRQVMLTDDGQKLFIDVKMVLWQLADSCNLIRSHVYSKNITIVSTVAMANYWLFPRIARFNMEYPDININIYATDDINEEHCRKSDLGILYGYDKWQTNLTGHYLFRERIYPICAYDMSLTEINTPEDLLNNRIVHFDPLKWRWMNWGDWFSYFGIHYHVPSNSLIFNQVPLAVNAALKGMGITLGWEFMLKEMLENRFIKIAGDFYVETGRADYLVYSTTKPLSASAGIFRDWLLNDAEKDVAQLDAIVNNTDVQAD
ncbi:LysR substrate-binding domain-containing protein [Oceanisphaera sp. KMM 10153]|uniref:LysR substrate-binding domain-containing protein n=1 Tax=Oceanisphaera submarina TaxID=3390193 RepID=UPI0039763F72